MTCVWPQFQRGIGLKRTSPDSVAAVQAPGAWLRNCGAAFGQSSGHNGGDGDTQGGTRNGSREKGGWKAEVRGDHDKRCIGNRHIAERRRDERMGNDHGYDAAAVTTGCPAPQQAQAQARGVVQRVQRWVFLYNVTTGLYMLDWWERCLFNAVFVMFFLVACYNSGHYLRRLGAVLLAWCNDDAVMSFAFGHGIRDGFLGGGVGGGGVMN